MEKTITCEISFIPIQSIDYKIDVDEVIDIISNSGLKYIIGLMSTTIVGTKQKIFSLIQEIFDQMENKTKFTISVKMSNECGCN